MSVVVGIVMFSALLPTHHCPYCGHELVDYRTDKYCSECGNKLDTIWKYNAFNKPENFLRHE